MYVVTEFYSPASDIHNYVLDEYCRYAEAEAEGEGEG